MPSISILAEPPVAVVDAVARRHGTTAVAEEYLQYLYTPEAQDLIAQAPLPARADPAAAAKYAAQFPKLELFTIDEDFGGWKNGAGDASSPTAASSTRSTCRGAEAPMAALARTQIVLPGFGLTLGFTLALPRRCSC